MVQPEEPNSKEKAVVTSSAEAEESNAIEKAVASSAESEEYNCPRCTRTFNSIPGLCGHQNAHRLVKEPMKMSPVLAAVLNNPLPPFDKPPLLPPRPNGKAKAKAKPKGVKEGVSKQPGAGNASSPRKRPRKRQDKEPIQDNLIKQMTSNNNNPREKPEGEDFLRLILENGPENNPFERVVPENNQEYSHPQRITMDLLGEWMPISGFGDDGRLGTFSGETLSDPISRNYQREGEAGLEIGLNTSAGHLDLELKLGF
ncbi:hypothetical protein PTKIN_Ptkin06aG0079100 [Pterospermum kingtungense]